MSPSTFELRDIQTTSLSNGLRIATECMPHVRSVSVGVWIGTGSRRETPKESGISHFIEHMVFKGTAKRSAEDIARISDEIGGHLDAYTSKELVSYNNKVLDEHLPLAFDVLADVVLSPVFRQDDIEKEKGVILEELKAEADNPEYVVHEMFSARFYGKHPLGQPILGTRETIRSFQSPFLRDYYSRFYVPSNMVITAAGHLEHQHIVDLAQKYFGELPAGELTPPGPAPEMQPDLVLRSKKSLEQVHLCLGVPAYPLMDERRYGCFVLNTILGGGMSSRLFQKVREQEGLAYSIFSELNLYRDAGCLAVYGGTSTATLARMIDMVISEFREMKANAVAPDELRRAKEHLKGSIALGMESTSSRMSNLARQALFFGRFFGLDEMVAAIEKVTADDVQRIAQDLLDGDRLALAVLGNLNGFKIDRSALEC